MQYTVWCKASCTYTNQIIAILIKNWKELLNCLCSTNHQCKVVLQRWWREWQYIHNVSCVWNSPFLQQSSQPTHLAVKCNIMLDGVNISKESPTGKGAGAGWSINNLHSVSVHILMIWWGTQTDTQDTWGHTVGCTHFIKGPPYRQSSMHTHTTYIQTS